MKFFKSIFLYNSFLLLLILSSCSSLQKNSTSQQDLTANKPQTNPEISSSTIKSDATNSLPVRFQTPSYTVGLESKEDLSRNDTLQLKVGAKITSKGKPLVLRDILKKLAELKRMNISWASDVNQESLVDVDIKADDVFYLALENLLAQLSYFPEINGSTIFIRNKITKKYTIAMPFITQQYSTDAGGDVMSETGEGGFKGTINLKSTGSPVGASTFGGDGQKKADFDIWANIETNLNILLDITEESQVLVSESEQEYGREGKYTGKGSASSVDESSGTNKNAKVNESGSTDERALLQSQAKFVKSSRRIAKDGSYFIIDKPVGIVTVTATREHQERIEQYLNSLKKELYKQISIEAKIIEVIMHDESSLGLDWSSVLKNFSVTGAVQFGSQELGGQVYPYVFANESGTDGNWDDGTNHGKIQDPTRFVSKVSLNPANFSVFLNALEEQGDANVLSNPKISVMNGQPAFITIGKKVTYIEKIDSEVDDETGDTTYTVDTAGILSGIGLAITGTILENNNIVLNLVPLTSNLEEPIEYRDIGNNGMQVGLPKVQLREMSTTVRVKNGEMLVIGGLIDNYTTNDSAFAPVVGKIPIIKYLFGNETKINHKRELIILLRPIII